MTCLVLTALAAVLLTSEATLVLFKCCPPGQALTTACHDSSLPFKPPSIFAAPGGLPLLNVTFTLRFQRPDCDLLYFLEPEREPAERFWVLADGSLTRARDGPVAPGNYCLEVIPALNAVLPVLCFPEGEEEGRGVYAVYPLGMLVSIPFLFMTLVVYSCLKELSNLHGRCLICHVLCLLLGYLFLATIQVDTTAIPPRLCLILGYAIQFFFMATFFWLNVMCFDIYWAFSGLKNLRGSVSERERKKLIVYSVYAWCCPLVILTVTVAVDFSPSVPVDSVWKPNVGVDKCFFKDDGGTWIYFYLPMAVIIFSNLILFGITAFRIWTHRKESAVLKRGDSRKHDTNDKERFNLYLKLFVVMGINWVMELVSFIVGGPGYLWYIPDFTNTLQGVFIFLIFVWKKRVRRLIWAKLCACFGKKPPIGPGTRHPWSSSTRGTNNSISSTAMSTNSVKLHPTNATTVSQTTLA